MKGLSRSQFKRQEEERLDYRLVTDDVSSMVLDPKDFCGLMASECFDIVKCMLYSRSASLSCRRCPTRYPLEKTQDAIWTVRGTRMATTGECSKCEQEKTLVAGGQCHRCKYGDWKDLSKTEVLKLLASGNVRVRRSPKLEKGSSHSVAKPPLQEAANPLKEVAEGAKLMTDFSKDPGLLEKILDSAKRSRRPAGQHVLHLLEKGLVGEHGQLLKIIEHVRKYPIPNGSPREVFQSTLDLIKLRVEELADGTGA